MQSPIGFDDLARLVVPVARGYGIEHISLIPPQEGAIVDDEGKMHLLLNLDGSSAVLDFNALANDLEGAVGCVVELYTLESIRHSLYGKDVIRRSVMLRVRD